jgi:hypothetical protein
MTLANSVTNHHIAFGLEAFGKTLIQRIEKFEKDA